MKCRDEIIQAMIDDRLDDNDVEHCSFQILLLNKEVENILENLLVRNHCSIKKIDTVEGCWNLDDTWYEINNVDAVVEYCGIYPIKWKIEDAVLLEKLYKDRDIYIQVYWKKQCKDGVEYILNH